LKRCSSLSKGPNGYCSFDPIKGLRNYKEENHDCRKHAIKHYNEIRTTACIRFSKYSNDMVEFFGACLNNLDERPTTGELMKHQFYRKHNQIFAEAKAFLSLFLSHAIYKAESSRERSNKRPINDWRNIYLFNAHNKY
jgi:menaquinone-dependent protoporphyrinogen IX oxidase